MQIEELDDQRRRYLHRSGAPQREGRPKGDIATPEIRPNLNELDPETECQQLERIGQDQEQLQQPERALEMFNQELA
uniref:Uncharacterized protein n=1 Tax=Romanomermis culicivorax TaxID=13658 RepID=A0A915K4Y6_ROMCU